MNRTPEKINLVVGAGFSGAVIAQNIAQNLNERVLLIDRKDHIGGNSFDYIDKNGISIHKYGSHIFHTNSEQVWKYLNRFSGFNTYMHKVYAVIDGIETTIPFNFNTLHEVFPASLAQRLEQKLLDSFEYNSRVPILEFQKYNDCDLNFLAKYIYEKVFLHYTKKQWGEEPKNIDGAVTARVPVLISRDSRYFQDKYQGIPLCGYTKLIERIIDNPLIEVNLKTDYKKIKSGNYKRIFYTGSIDEFFDYKYGTLPYRSVYFKYEEYNRPYYQKNSVINYPNNYDFTRIHEFKYYNNEESDSTVIAKEYSQAFKDGENERYYPIVNEKNLSLYNRYAKLAKRAKNLYFLGRLGDYKYYDMDKAVARALECFDELLADTLTDGLKSTFGNLQAKEQIGGKNEQ